jgi:hypothetical protein
MHRDHAWDQARDHGTKDLGPNPLGLAEEVLVAVAEGDPRSLELAARLCEAVLADDITLKAKDALQLLATGSPFALVRIVELAERLLARERACVLDPQSKG